MSLEFDQPLLLLLAVVGLPLAFIGWRAVRTQDPLRAWTIVALRLLAIAMFALILAEPRLRREHDHLTVIGLLDVSGSVRRFVDVPSSTDELASAPVTERLRQWFRAATDTRAPDDRFGLVVFDGRAIVISTPVSGEYIDDNLEIRLLEGTNIADAIQLGLALFPADTAKRLVLVTDGNETGGDALAAAERAAGGLAMGAEASGAQGVPIDVLPLPFRVENDVQVVRVEAPPNAQPGQTVTVRVVLESLRETTGTLTLLKEGGAVDLNGDAPGTRRPVRVPAGVSVQLAQVELGDTPINRFEAIFEPTDAAGDALIENNRAQAFTATPSRGTILFVDGVQTQDSDFLADTLEQADLRIIRIAPEAIPTDILSLQSYDLVIFQNVSAMQVSTDVQRLLAQYVNDLGGGFLKIGGDRSFGAGGWNGTPIAEILPVELDLPKEIRLPRAALVLVIDKSGSMSAPVTGALATQQQVANEGAVLAIRSLQKENLVGVVTFDSLSYEHVPLQPNENPDAMAEKILSIAPGGGTSLAPALRRAGLMLRGADADRKRIVFLTDGRSGEGELLADMTLALRAEGIQVSTIAVGDSADQATLARMAEVGEGEFYPVSNPAMLPRILIDSVQVINRPLLKERLFVPVVLPTGTTLTSGMEEAPALGGLVITAPRKDPKAVLDMTGEEGDPLLARWQAGLGRVAAFTSDAHGDWSNEWLDWPGYARFWTELVRQTARPVVSQDYELIAAVERDTLRLSLDATDPEAGAMDYLQVEGTVYSPSGEAIPVRLNQTGPGRYEATVDAPESGNYIVALTPRRGEERLAPILGGANQPSGAEFRRYRSNLALLEEIARLTNGRMLDLAQPTRIDLYDRAGLPTNISLLPAWREVMPWLFALLLLDIASRRLAWDRATLASLVSTALHWRPYRTHTGEASPATLASLRARSDAFDAAIARDSSGVKQFERTGSPLRLVRRSAADEEQTPEADERPRKVASVLDRLSGRKPEPDEPAEKKKPAAPARPKPEKPPEPQREGGLFEAKRRARERFRRGESEKE